MMLDADVRRGIGFRLINPCFPGVLWTARHVAPRTRAKPGIAGTAEWLWFCLAPTAASLSLFRTGSVAIAERSSSAAWRQDLGMKGVAWIPRIIFRRI